MCKRDACVLEAKRIAEQFIKDVAVLESKGMWAGKHYATVKRRSMDLSNALANLRKSPYVDNVEYF